MNCKKARETQQFLHQVFVNKVSVFCLVLLNGLSRGRGAPVAQPQLLAATGLATALTAALGTTTSGAAFLGG